MEERVEARRSRGWCAVTSDFHAEQDRAMSLAGFVRAHAGELDPARRDSLLALTDACFERVNVGTVAEPSRTIPGAVRDMATLEALAAQFEG